MRSKSFTIISLEDDRLTYDSFADLKSLEARVISLEVEGVKFLVVGGDIVHVTIDRSPRISFEEDKISETPVKKPRARRRSKAEMEAARAEEKARKKANGSLDGEVIA